MEQINSEVRLIPVALWAKELGLSRREAYRMVERKQVESVRFGAHGTMVVQRTEAPME